MAKFLSQVYTVIRGSVGGVTYLAGPHHALICRARVAPVNPGSPNQNLIRSFWCFAATGWRSLTAVQRRDWNNYALSVQFQSPTGPYTVLGRNLFTAYLAVHYYLGNFAIANWVTQTAPTAPGALLSPAVASDAPLAAPGVGRQLNVTNNNSGKVTFYAEVSPVQSAIRNNYKGPFDSSTIFNIPIVAAGATAALSITGLVTGGTYFARIGAITTGIDLAGAVPCRVAQSLIYRFVATTTV
jgi:hypothetical protein